MNDEILERLLDETAAFPETPAPSRLKSRIYSALMRRHGASGPLLALPDTRAAGYGLCVFEWLTNVCPTGDRVKQLNLCSMCHARVLAERLEEAPIFWHNCPYVDFQNR